LAIGENVTKVQELFSKVFNVASMNDLGSKFDHLLKDDDVLCAGTIEVKTISTPGHIPACTSYLGPADLQKPVMSMSTKQR